MDVGRYTIDHNVIYNVWLPGLFNHIKYLNIYNNVFLNSGSEYSAVNANAGSTPVNGENIKMHNNIFSRKPNNDGCCYGATMNNADVKNFIHIADGLPGTSQNDLFMDAANHDYHLKPTATAAINKGISVGIYDDANVVGLPDIGAYEYTGAVSGLSPEMKSTTEIHPNPAAQSFSVLTQSPNARITVMSLNGKVMKTVAASGKLTTIGLENWPAGIYTVKTQSGAEISFKKIVVCK